MSDLRKCQTLAENDDRRRGGPVEDDDTIHQMTPLRAATAGSSGDPSLLDDSGRVAADLSCAGCGYNLRTQSREGICPECGSAVASSCYSKDLCDVPAGSLRWTARGAMLVAITGVILIANAGLPIWWNGVVLRMAGRRAIPSAYLFESLPPALAWIIPTSMVFLLAPGLILLTRPLPGIAGQRARVSARRAVRVALMLMPMSVAGLWALLGVLVGPVVAEFLVRRHYFPMLPGEPPWLHAVCYFSVRELPSILLAIISLLHVAKLLALAREHRAERYARITALATSMAGALVLTAHLFDAAGLMAARAALQLGRRPGREWQFRASEICYACAPTLLALCAFAGLAILCYTFRTLSRIANENALRQS